MFRMATGRLPFEDASGLEVLVRHIKEIPPTPKSVNPSVPSTLDLMIMKLLQKDRSLRYQTTEELLEAIDAAITELGGVAPSISENHEPTTRLTPVGQRQGSSARGQVFEESGLPKGQGMGLKFFVLVFLGIVVLAAGIFGLLSLFKGKSAGEKQAVSKPKDEKDNAVAHETRSSAHESGGSNGPKSSAKTL